MCSLHHDKDYNDEDDYDYAGDTYKSPAEQEAEDDYIESRGGIDKCMNCGKYMYNDQLNYSPQVCKIPCKNPREY